MNLKKSKKWLALFGAALLLPLPACSQKEAASISVLEAATAESASNYRGTVQAIRADSITIAVQDSGEVTIPLTEQTVFTRGGMGGGPQGDGAGEQPPEMPTQPEGERAADDSQPPEPQQEGAPSNGDSAPQENTQPPAKPEEGQDAENSGGESEPADGATPPEKPDGEAQPSGQPETLTYESVQVGDEVTIVLADDGSAATVMLPGGDMGGPGGGASQPDSYDAANTYTEDASVTDTTLTSTGVDESVVYLGTADATVTLDGVKMDRTSAESAGGDASSFYGVGAAALVTDGTLRIADSTITTDAKGGAGVFAYGDGTAYVEDSAITTEQDTSGGIHVAGGGTLYAWDLQVETSGESSAAIRSDRGSGTMVVDGGRYTSNGEGSPAVYSTADITVHDASLTANGSEAICIEGLNTIRLFDCELTGHMSDLPQNDCTWNVILYQSMSGDSTVGNSTFEMVGGSLTAKNGGMFYTTNTESTFVLSGVAIENAADSEFLLRCTGNSNQRGWGTAGNNGADCHFTGIGQVLEGTVIWDSISQLDLYLTQGSTLTGTVVDDESNAGGGGDGYANLYIDSDSCWVVTGDSALTSLACAGELVDADGNAVTVVGNDGTIYRTGSSPYTVTVASYTAEPDLSGASTADHWDHYAVERP